MQKDSWGALVDRYDEWHTFMAGADLVDLVREQIAAAVRDGDVVELGCGTGLYTRAYAPGCGHVIATDGSRRMLERAEVELADLPQVEFREADAHRTGLPSGAADAVVAVNLLHIADDPQGIIDEMRRLAKPGGAIVIADATISGMSFGHVLSSIWRTVKVSRGSSIPRGGHNLSQPHLEAMVRKAGLELVGGHEIDGEVMNSAFVTAVAPAA